MMWTDRWDAAAAHLAPHHGVVAANSWACTALVLVGHPATGWPL